MGLLLVSGTIYMSMAWFNDVAEITTWNFQAIRFTLTGSSLVVLAYIMSIWMIMKYARAIKKGAESLRHL